MKSKMKLAAVAALVLGCSASAFAGNSVDFKTSINVVAPDYCGIDVAPAGNSTWSLKWALAADANTGTLTLASDSGTDPLFVNVKVKEASSAACNLANMTFGASLPATSAHLDDTAAFRVATLNDGFWRYMPVVSKLELFTDVAGVADGNTGKVDLTHVKVTDAKATEHMQADTASHAAATEVNDLSDFNNNPAMTLTDNYLADNGVAPLSIGTGNTDVKYALTEALPEGEFVKAARIGVGALVAKNPEDADGATKLEAVADGNTVSLPFTLNVTNM